MRVSFKSLLMIAVALLVAPVAALASNTVPKYSYAQIFTSNSTVDLIPTTSAIGDVYGIKCIFPSSAGGASVNVKFTVDGGTTHTITIDPTFLEQDEGSQYVSAWVPMDIFFQTSIHVQLNNTSLGTATINCWASWATS
jgi:hypothetical protein